MTSQKRSNLGKLRHVKLMKVRSCPATWVLVPWAIQTCLPSCFLLSDKKRIRYGWALIGGTNPLQNGHLSYFKKYLVHCYVLDKTWRDPAVAAVLKSCQAQMLLIFHNSRGHLSRPRSGTGFPTSSSCVYVCIRLVRTPNKVVRQKWHRIVHAMSFYC